MRYIYAGMWVMAAALLLASPALADTVDFTTGHKWFGTSLEFDGGVVTATFGGEKGPEGYTGWVVKSSSGLGVNDKRIDDNSKYHGEGYEFLVITFDRQTALESVTFEQAAGKSDSFDLWIDGVDQDVEALLSSDVIRKVGTGKGGTYTVDLSAFEHGTVFAFTDGTAQSRGDDYTVAMVSYHANPLPPAAFLGMAMLGGMAVIRRMRRRR